MNSKSTNFFILGLGARKMPSADSCKLDFSVTQRRSSNSNRSSRSSLSVSSIHPSATLTRSCSFTYCVRDRSVGGSRIQQKYTPATQICPLWLTACHPTEHKEPPFRLNGPHETCIVHGYEYCTI